MMVRLCQLSRMVLRRTLVATMVPPQKTAYFSVCCGTCGGCVFCCSCVVHLVCNPSPAGVYEIVARRAPPHPFGCAQPYIYSTAQFGQAKACVARYVSVKCCRYVVGMSAICC